MTKEQLSQLGKTLWAIADDLRGAMNADDFRDYMRRFCFCATCLRTTRQQRKQSWGGIIPR